ncbi:hypothetical protein F511_30997 [Dorcoceras hygrometricum]|uniref:Uncharacterized protein n=1 Tax=Dorcoceras hygrometricum TaxID=472368 RepID=A0A2Z7CAH6_9LAMI|nr:hypothetical protein F511_30997 [Dorcoceras hygrometricum]
MKLREFNYCLNFLPSINNGCTSILLAYIARLILLGGSVFRKAVHVIDTCCNNNNSNGIQIPNTQKRGASPDTVHIINITGTHGKGGRPAEPPICPAWLPEDPATGAWLRPVSRGNRHFTVGGGRLCQSGPRPKGRLLRQPAIEGLTRSARTNSHCQVGRNKFRRSKAAAAAFEERKGAAHLDARVRVLCNQVVIMRSRTPQNPPQVLNTLSLVSVQESRIQYLCDPQWFRDTASRGPTTIVAPESQFRTCPSDHADGLVVDDVIGDVIQTQESAGSFHPDARGSDVVEEIFSRKLLFISRCYLDRRSYSGFSRNAKITRRKQQQHPVESLYESAVATQPVASFAYSVDLVPRRKESKKQLAHQS